MGRPLTLHSGSGFSFVKRGMTGMTTGELASRAGVKVATIRFYERRGLLRAPARTPSGYRQYGPDEVERVRFVRRAQGLGFTLDEIQDLLALRVEHVSACAAVAARAREKLDRVERKVREVERMKQVLERLVFACEAREPTNDCPILAVLEEGKDA